MTNPTSTAAGSGTPMDLPTAVDVLPAQEAAQAGGQDTAAPGRADPGAATPLVVGLDPSLTGFGIASSTGWVDKVGADGLTTLPLAERSAALRGLARQVLELVGTPDLVVVELPAYSRTGGGTSERGSLWWRVIDGLLDREVPVATVMPNTRIRYATGKGVGSKGAVIDAAARRWPQFETGGDDNLADAVVLMAMGRDQLGHPLADMPKTHRAALAAVTWPEAVTP